MEKSECVICGLEFETKETDYNYICEKCLLQNEINNKDKGFEYWDWS